MFNEEWYILPPFAEGCDCSAFTFPQPWKQSVCDVASAVKGEYRLSESENYPGGCELRCPGSESSDLHCFKSPRELLLQEWISLIDVFENYRRRRFENTTTRGSNVRWPGTQKCYSLLAFAEDAEVYRDQFQRFSRTLGMDDFGKQSLADPSLSCDHERLRASREVRNSRLEPGDRETAAYDLEGIQSSGPEKTERGAPQGKRWLAAGGLLDSKGLWDSEGGLFGRDQIAARAAIEDYLDLCITWLLSRLLRNVSVFDEGETWKQHCAGKIRNRRNGKQMYSIGRLCGRKSG